MARDMLALSYIQDTSHFPSSAFVFSSLMSFPCILVPPTKEAWRDLRKPNVERGNKEIEFKRNETFFNGKRHIKRPVSCS